MHESVARRLDPFSGRLVTTDPVITDSMHLLADARDGPMLLAEFILATNLHIAESTRPAAIRQAAELMPCPLSPAPVSALMKLGARSAAAGWAKSTARGTAS